MEMPALLALDEIDRAIGKFLVGLAETDAARAKILWQLMTDAQRNLLCTPDTSRALRGHALMAPDGKGPDSGTEIRGPPKGMP